MIIKIIYKYDFFKSKVFFVQESLSKKEKKKSNENIVLNDFDFTSNDFKLFEFAIKKRRKSKHLKSIMLLLNKFNKQSKRRD